MPKLSELLQTAHDPNPTPDDAIPTLKEEGGEATNKMVYLEDLPVSTPTQTALNGKVSKAGDTMTGRLYSTVNHFSNTHIRGGETVSFGLSPALSFSLYNANTNTYLLTVPSDNTGIRLGTSSSLGILHGTGFPNGVVSAPVGSIYIDTNATSGASSWIKKSGTWNTGWIIATASSDWHAVTDIRDTTDDGSKRYITADLAGISYRQLRVNYGFRAGGSMPLNTPMRIELYDASNNLLSTTQRSAVFTHTLTTEAATTNNYLMTQNVSAYTSVFGEFMVQTYGGSEYKYLSGTYNYGNSVSKQLTGRTTNVATISKIVIVVDSTANIEAPMLVVEARN